MRGKNCHLVSLRGGGGGKKGEKAVWKIETSGRGKKGGGGARCLSPAERPLRRLPSTLGEGLKPESEAPVEGALEISASKIFDQ